jgi:hypothetical protein
MWHLYLDESGDLGFDFVHKKPSSFFTVTILVVKGVEDNRALINGVKVTIKRKLNVTKKQQGLVTELKGQRTSIKVKEYFYRQVTAIPFEIYCVTMNKRQAFAKLAEGKHRVYNYIARLVLEQISFDDAISRVELIIDKSKNKAQIHEFNSYIVNHLQGKLNPNLPLDIYHRASDQEYGLQAVDMFSWGVFRKYERGDIEWLKQFSDKVYGDKQYP